MGDQLAPHEAHRILRAQELKQRATLVADTTTKLLRRRDALDETIVGRRNLAVAQRLFDWSINPSDKEGLASAGEQALTIVQEELRQLQRRSLVDPGAGLELAYVKEWAIIALIEALGWSSGQVKKLHLRLTADAPLAVCTGKVQYPLGRYTPPPFLGSITKGEVIVDGEAQAFRVPAFGCFKVFQDTTKTTGQIWRHWCPDHDPTATKPLRRVRRAHAKALQRH